MERECISAREKVCTEHCLGMEPRLSQRISSGSSFPTRHKASARANAVFMQFDECEYF